MLPMRSLPNGGGATGTGLGAATAAGATGAEASLAAFKATAVKGAAGAGIGSEMTGGGGVDIFTALVSTGTRSRS